MTRHRPCQQTDCFFPSASCNAGFMDVSQCPHYRLEKTRAATQLTVEDEKFPWTGRPFGLTDLRFVTTVRRPHVIGLAGMADAGKTTLLGMLFLMIYRGYAIVEDARFAGSFTLHGWEAITRYLQHNAEGAIQFPPHTTETGRLPGLLHLRFAGKEHNTRDLVLCDAPGEWFANWTENPDAENAAGARWIAAHADRLIIVADTDALTGPHSGLARKNLDFLIRRVRNNVSPDAVALAWTKSDLPRPDDLITKTHRQFTTCFPQAPRFAVQVPDQAPPDEHALHALADLFRWAFDTSPRTFKVDWPRPNQLDDVFLSYRGHA